MRRAATAAVVAACALALLVRADEAPALLETDSAVLRTLQKAWAPEGWDPDAPPCTWPGVKCAEVVIEGRSIFSGRQQQNVVRAITLRNVCQFAPEEHVCEVPPAIGQLYAAESLYLAGNGFAGFIPPELGQLTSLKHLFLNSNELWGDIPDTLGQLVNLEKLHLNHNKLSGSIPAALAGAKKLHQLELQNNELSGSLPPELARSPKPETHNPKP
jgi:hypothetical protein